MISHFSFGAPVQSTTETGIRFCLKSPAVGSTERHCPFGSRIDTPSKARTAVSSRWCDSAAAVGCSVPPARDTGTGVVGLAVGMPPASSPSSGAALALGAAEETAAAVEDGVASAGGSDAVTTTVRVRFVHFVVLSPAGADGVAPASVVVLITGDTASSFPVPLSSPPVAAPPNVKDWLTSPALQSATSKLSPLTVKHEPAWFRGSKAKRPAVPSKENIWESVTSPPVCVMSAIGETSRC